MKIAIMIPGHLRTWEIVKPNFIANALDPNHQIDVFVDTYNEFFRKNYSILNESNMFNYGFVHDDAHILNLFSGINVVDFKIENEILCSEGLRSSMMQVRKLKKIYETVKSYEEINGNYDLIMRVRPDNELDDKIDYQSILKSVTINPMKIFISQGGAFNKFINNDMLAIGKRKAMDIYMNRFFEVPFIACDDGGQIIFDSMEYIANKYGIVYDQSIEITAIKADGSTGKWFKFKHGSYYPVPFDSTNNVDQFNYSSVK